MYNKNLFIDKIQDGVVYIGWENYSEDEKNSIESLINDWVEYTIDDLDLVIDGNYFSGLDWDYEEDYKPEKLCWCNDIDGNEIEYECDGDKPKECEYTSDSEIRQKIVDKAYTRLGEPYKWSCEFNEKGGDCSGLIDWTLRNVDGIDSPYNGRETSCVLHNLITGGNKGRKNNLGKGDILIFYPRSKKWTCTEDNPGHVGFVYDTDGDKVDMIDAASGKGVRILKDVFNKRIGKNRYYGVIPIVDGKYESK